VGAERKVTRTLIRKRGYLQALAQATKGEGKDFFEGEKRKGSKKIASPFKSKKNSAYPTVIIREEKHGEGGRLVGILGKRNKER